MFPFSFKSYLKLKYNSGVGDKYVVEKYQKKNSFPVGIFPATHVLLEKELNCFERKQT
jgi:hypothetical protein